MKQPIINIGGSPQKGTGHLASTGNRIAPVTRIVIDGRDHEDNQVSYSGQFDAWLNSIRNTQAPAIDDGDYQIIADRWECHVAWVRAVFAVESAGSGFESNGTTKALNERHVTRKQVLKCYPKQAKAIAKRLGGGLYSMRAGGYKGGVAEWQRIKEVCCGVAEETGDFEGALDLALSSASHGKPQIMGYHATKLLGFDSPRSMLTAFHENEDSHLKAFCDFVEKNGLNRHLKSATGVKDPYPYIKKFALGYNGKRCCDRGTKRKNYAAEIIRHYRAIADDFEEFSSLAGSRTMQGASVATAANAGKGLILAEMAGLTDITSAVKQISAYKDQAQATIAEAQAMTEKVGGLLAENAEMASSLSNNRAMVFFMLALLVASQFGTIQTIYARITDRLRGYK